VEQVAVVGLIYLVKDQTAQKVRGVVLLVVVAADQVVLRADMAELEQAPVPEEEVPHVFLQDLLGHLILGEVIILIIYPLIILVVDGVVVMEIAIPVVEAVVEADLVAAGAQVEVDLSQVEVVD
jgi:hypothetical protein